MYRLRKLGESNSISTRQRLIQLIHNPAQLLPEELIGPQRPAPLVEGGQLQVLHLYGHAGGDVVLCAQA